MIFEFDIINYKSIKKRLLTKKIENINTKMKRIINYVKKYVINVVKRIIARVNQYQKFIEFEIKNYVWLNNQNIKIVRFFDKLKNKNLKFYLVTKKKQIYELEFSNIMYIHSMFHFWFLRKKFQIFLFEQKNDSLESIILNKNLEWEIDNITDFRYYYYRFQYWVNWTKYFHDRTWYYVNNQKFANV